MNVAQLWRYPVKSFRGESLQSARFGEGGIEHDRRFMLVDQSQARSGKPLTARQVPKLLKQAASVANGAVVVTADDGTAVRSDNAGFEAALQKLIERPVSLHEDTTGDNHDDSDVLVINLASVRAISEEYGSPRDPLRFRPNVMLDGTDAVPFVELQWIGKRFALGDAVLEIVKPDERCVLTTIDPQTIEIDPAFLKFVVQRHGGVFGVYCRVVGSGVARVGDTWNEVV